MVELFARDGFATCMTPLASFTHTTGQGYAYGNPRDWLRLTGEVIALHSRRGEYVTAGLPYDRNDTQFQFSTRLFY